MQHLGERGGGRWEDRHQGTGGVERVHLTPKAKRKGAKKKKLEPPKEVEFGWKEMRIMYFVKFWLYF